MNTTIPVLKGRIRYFNSAYTCTLYTATKLRNDLEKNPHSFDKKCEMFSLTSDEHN